MIKLKVDENKMKKIEEKHWKWFSETGKEKLDDYLNNKVYRDLIENKQEKIPDDVYELLNFLSKDNILKPILIGKLLTQTEKYNSIDNIIKKIECKFPFLFDSKKSETNKVLKRILNDVFNYDNFIRVNKINSNNNRIKWDAYELLNELKITACPYCNRQYIHTYISENGKTRADIDHFYPKSKYPFLAISLYNFIPSCHTCNSSFKGSIDFYEKKAVYPYEEEFGEDAKFETKFYTDEDVKDDDKIYDIKYLLGNSDNFKIGIEPKGPKSEIGEKIQNSIKTFHLKELYNFHKDYVRELIKKAIVYNESRIDELYTEFPELFSSKEEVLQMVISNYICDEDLGKRPLSKLTKDICDELGLKLSTY